MRASAHKTARWVAAATLLVGLALPRVSSADPLPSNDYAIDLFQGPLLLPTRIIALGGAYAGYGEDVSGMASNAAAPAVREPQSFRHLELDLKGSISIPIDFFENNDFDNNGSIDQEYSDFLYLIGGLIAQVGGFGVGLVSELQTYTLTAEQGRETNVILGRHAGLVAGGFLRGQLNIGGGVRALTMQITTAGADLVYAGAAPQLGILLKPVDLPVRFGATYRFQVVGEPVSGEASDRDADGVARSGGLTLPNGLLMPWEVEAGMALQFGDKQLNLPFDDPEDIDDPAEARVERQRAFRANENARLVSGEFDPARRTALIERLAREETEQRKREDQWLRDEANRQFERVDAVYATRPRAHLLFLTSLLVSGSVERGVSLERFLAQPAADAPSNGVIGHAGASINFSPRFGVETEPVDNVLVLRAGAYYEPSRFGGVGRQHFTFGGQARLLSWDVFGLLPELAYGVEAALDLAPRYSSASISLTTFR